MVQIVEAQAAATKVISVWRGDRCFERRRAVESGPTPSGFEVGGGGRLPVLHSGKQPSARASQHRCGFTLDGLADATKLVSLRTAMTDSRITFRILHLRDIPSSGRGPAGRRQCR